MRAEQVRLHSRKIFAAFIRGSVALIAKLQWRARVQLFSGRIPWKKFSPESPGRIDPAGIRQRIRAAVAAAGRFEMCL